MANSADIYAGQELRRARQEKSISQKQLANELGVTFQQVQKYEKGINRISVGRLTSICRTLGVSPLRFFNPALMTVLLVLGGCGNEVQQCADLKNGMSYETCHYLMRK